MCQYQYNTKLRTIGSSGRELTCEQAGLLQHKRIYHFAIIYSSLASTCSEA